MRHTKDAVKKDKVKKNVETCVCNMEWRGPHDDAWSDCVCYPEEQNKGKN